jgi:hypothetical protein
MSNLPKLVTTNLNDSLNAEQFYSPSAISPLTPSQSNSNQSLNTERNRERVKFKGVIDKFVGNFNGIVISILNIE